MIRVRDTGEVLDGSPLIAFGHHEAPFSTLILCDNDEDNADAVRSRTAGESSRVSVVYADCNSVIDEIASRIPTHGLNFALVDPFALRELKFDTIERLARFKRMDLMIHFPTGDIKRNLEHNDNTKRWLTEALGTSTWPEDLTSLTNAGRLIELFKSQLSLLGYGSQQVRSEPIKNNKNLPLYYIVFASKSGRGDAIWQSITKNKPSGQRGLGF